MISELTNRINMCHQRTTNIIMIIICAIIPFIYFRKVVSNEYITAIDASGYYKSVAIYILATLCFVVLLSRLIFSPFSEIKIKVKPSLFLFTIWAAISTFFSYDMHTSIYGFPVRYNGLLMYLSLYMFYLLVVNLFDAKYMKIIIYIILISSSLMVVICTLEFHNINILLILLPNTRRSSTLVHATFGNSNVVGSYFSIMVPLATMMFMRSENLKENVILAFFSMLTIVGLIESTSRIAWFSVLITFVFLIVLIHERRLYFKKIALITVFTFVATFTLNFTGQQRMKESIENMKGQLITAKDYDLQAFGSYRLYAYQKFVKLSLERSKHALVGVGPDCLINFGDISTDDLNKHPSLDGVVFDKAHSDPIEYLASMGIPSLIFYMYFIFSILLHWFKKINIESPEMTCVFAGWLGYLIQSLFNVHSISLIAIFYVFSAIIERSANDIGSEVSLKNRLCK